VCVVSQIHIECVERDREIVCVCVVLQIHRVCGERERERDRESVRSPADTHIVRGEG
jgi:hypothetical protein